MSPPQQWTPGRGWVDDEDDVVGEYAVVEDSAGPAEPVAPGPVESDVDDDATGAAPDEAVAMPVVAGRPQPEVWEVPEVTGHPRVDEALAGVNAFADAAPAEQVQPLTEAHAALRSTLDSIGDV